VFAPFIAVICPPLIPLLVIFAIWRLTDGGETVGPWLEARRAMSDPELDIARSKARRGPLPVGIDPYTNPDEDEED